MTIRLSTEEDTEDILRIAHEVPQSQWITEKDCQETGYVVEANGHIVGYSLYLLGRATVYITALGVAKAASHFMQAKALLLLVSALILLTKRTQTRAIFTLDPRMQAWCNSLQKRVKILPLAPFQLFAFE